MAAPKGLSAAGPGCRGLIQGFIFFQDNHPEKMKCIIPVKHHGLNGRIAEKGISKARPDTLPQLADSLNLVFIPRLCIDLQNHGFSRFHNA